MRCAQCQDDFKIFALNKVTEGLFLCDTCNRKNIGAEPSLDLFLLELDFVTSRHLSSCMGARAMFLLLKRYKRCLPFLDFTLEPTEAICAFIKMFRQTDCIPNDEEQDVPLDTIAWCLLNEYGGLLVKAFKAVVEKKTDFQEGI